MPIPNNHKLELKRVDLGYYVLPKPPDPLKKYKKQWERIPHLAIRKEIVPFGYTVDPDDPDWLLPIDQDLALLELAKKHVKQYSYEAVAAWLSTHATRQLSGQSLKKRLDVERKRKKLASLKRFYAKRLETILWQIEELERRRLGAYQCDDRGDASVGTCNTCGSRLRPDTSSERGVQTQRGATN